MTRYDPARRIYQFDPELHGSARWASRQHLAARGYGPAGTKFLGYGLPAARGEAAFPVTTRTQRHLLTCAPTRSGKSVATVVPNLLLHEGSTVVVDPKGELAIITARRRLALGHEVHIVDPWNTAACFHGAKPGRFNVFDWLDPQGEDFVEDALLIADALIIASGRGEPFWPDEARALLMGLILHVATAPELEARRNLGQVRALLNLGPDEFRAMVGGAFRKCPHGTPELVRPGMAQSANEHVRAAAGRILNKADREFSSVLSTAQQNTHFLEAPRIRESLSHSDFDFRSLASGKTDIYLVLPAERLGTHARWLRLLLNIAITAVARLRERPDPPVYFLLDEMGALGRLDVVENAYGLMAGYGMQLHCIVQDLNQLADLYDRRWQTFIAGSGVIQCFGTRDLMTAEYVSKLCGVGTVETLTEATAARRASLFGDPDWLSQADAMQARTLITADEVMTLHPAAQVLVLAHADPVTAFKTSYFLDERFRDRLGRPLYDIHPHYARGPQPRAHDFTSPGADIGALLKRYMGD